MSILQNLIHYDEHYYRKKTRRPARRDETGEYRRIYFSFNRPAQRRICARALGGQKVDFGLQRLGIKLS